MGKSTPKIYQMTDDIIHHELELYENKFGMTSAVFLQRYNRGELGDEPEFIAWSGLLYIANATGAAMPALA